jgi:2-keto-4-pentenoate hydratase/2-oxohepta-3-ene-1,7-dioic acid hydratase in catechol pathway
MRLASVRTSGNPVLHVLVGSGWVPISTAAHALGIDGLDDLSDVADLYRLGGAAIAAAGRVSREAVGGMAGRSLEQLALGAVVRSPRSIVCIGRNYLDHINEGNVPVPEYPILFAKFPNTLVGHGQPVIAHEISKQLDYEGELVVVIGARASRVAPERWRDVVAGYTLINDVSDRGLQYRDMQWIRGKSLDTWAPLGPIFVSAEEIPDPHRLRLRTRVNGELRQDSPTSDMLFKIPALIAFITEAITLEPGDLVATGTPSGVGIGFDPPKWLQVGDVVEVEIAEIGILTSQVAAALP